MTLNPKVSLKSLIAPSFYKVHHAIKSTTAVYFWIKGGRGSTKSSFAAIQIIKGIMDDPNANALVLRKVGDTIRTSVHSLLIWAIHKLEAEDFFDWTTSPAEITYKPTGQKIIMKGMDKPEKLKSIALVKGYFKLVWFEEVAEFHGMQDIRSILQSTLRGGPDYKVFLTYNPPDDPFNWVNNAPDESRDDTLVHHSTYETVPPEWLGAQFIKDAVALRDRDYDRYRHEYLGEVVGRTDKLVMAGRWRVGTNEEFGSLDYDKLDGPYLGADWGFSTDPNVITKIWIDWDQMTAYVEYAQYGYKTETDDLPELFKQVPGSTENTIRADSARPETISYLRRNGFPKMRGVKKWPGSVEEGVNFLKQFIWVFHPRCTGAIEEAKNWSYKVNRGGDVLSQLEDKFNHFWDAARYALAPLIKQRDTEADIVDPSSTGGNFFDSAIVM